MNLSQALAAASGERSRATIRHNPGHRWPMAVGERLRVARIPHPDLGGEIATMFARPGSCVIIGHMVEGELDDAIEAVTVAEVSGDRAVVLAGIN